MKEKIKFPDACVRERLSTLPGSLDCLLIWMSSRGDEVP